MGRFDNVTFTAKELELVLQWQAIYSKNRIYLNYEKIADKYPAKHAKHSLKALMPQFDLEEIWEMLKSNQEEGFLVEDDRIESMYNKFHAELLKISDKPKPMIIQLLEDNGFEIRSHVNWGKGEQRLFMTDKKFGKWYYKKTYDSQAIHVTSKEHFLSLID